MINLYKTFSAFVSFLSTINNYVVLSLSLHSIISFFSYFDVVWKSTDHGRTMYTKLSSGNLDKNYTISISVSMIISNSNNYEGINIKGWSTLQRNSCANHNIMGVADTPRPPTPHTPARPGPVSWSPDYIIAYNGTFLSNLCVSHWGEISGRMLLWVYLRAKRTSTNGLLFVSVYCTFMMVSNNNILNSFFYITIMRQNALVTWLPLGKASRHT